MRIYGKACGFLCPECGNCCSRILTEDFTHILELACERCGHEFAVELASP